MPEQHAVLAAIAGLQDQMNQRFNTVDDKLADSKETADRLETRVRKVETDNARRKALEAAFGTVLTFVGWEHFKAAWIALTR